MGSVAEGRGGRRAEEAIAGNTRALEALRELIIYPFLYSHISMKLGLKWPRGLLLYGPPGTGKTSLVKAVVEECHAHLTVIKYPPSNPRENYSRFVGQCHQFNFIFILLACFLNSLFVSSAYSVHKAHAGESEKFLRESFSQAYSYASSGKPSVIFIDEIDAICPPRDNRREQESRVVGQLLTLMDGSRTTSKSLPHVVVVASTNRVDAIDPALRRSGRFDTEIEVNVPTAKERLKILELYARNLKLDQNVDIEAIAVSCNGYVGADLEALCREAARLAYRRSLNGAKEGEMLMLKMEDWENAKSEVGPSITRGVTKELSQVSWDDIGGLKDLKKRLQQAVEWPIKHPNAFTRLGISPIRGVLLHGPPGCSKTTLAKAAACAAQASFFSLCGAELYSKYVGEGEALLRRTFQKARLAAPSVLFFDEADVIAPKRSNHGGNSSGNATIGERLLSTLLTEMDGLELAVGIIVLAATNRPHAIDAALLRPGRFDLVLYVPPPDLEGRYEILRIHTRQMKLGADVDLRQIADRTNLFTGADLQGLCREAGMVALREDITADTVYDRHLQTARESLRPSLTKSMIEEYSQVALHNRD